MKTLVVFGPLVRCLWPGLLIAALAGMAAAGCDRRAQPPATSGQGRAVADSAEAEVRLYLAIEFRKPVASNMAAFQRLTGRRVVRIEGKGRCYVLMTESELREVLGLGIKTVTVKGAGNSMDTDASFTCIADAGSLRPAFRAIIRSIEIDDDPKIELLEARDALPAEDGRPR